MARGLGNNAEAIEAQAFTLPGGLAHAFPIA